MDTHDVSKEYQQAIATQRKTLERAMLRRGQRPHDRKSKEHIHSSFMLALMMRNNRPQMNLIHSSFVPPAYHPCVAPVGTLRPMTIKDLQLETHHRGRYILLRSITPPWRMTAIMAVMVDQDDDAVKLQLYQQEDENVRPAVNVIDTGSILLVKEPYFKVMGDGEYGLRVDHLSDAVSIDEDSDKLPDAWRIHSTAPKYSSESLKAKGNQYMAEGRYWDAIKVYSQALSQPGTADKIEVIKRNRSLAYLKISQFDAALADTGYPDLNSDSSEKALFRAAEALYYLRRFEECRNIAKILSDAHPNNKQALAVLHRSQNRVQEQKDGVYNFGKLQEDANKFRSPQLDQATYIGPVAVKQTETKGRGLFLTTAVKAGDLLLCEKAFCHAHAEGRSSNITLLMHPETNRAVMGGQADLIKHIVQKLHRNPSLAPEFDTLYHGNYQGVSVTRVDAQTVVDTFLVDTIMSYNVFGCPVSSLASHNDLLNNVEREEEAYHACGIWTRASYINHSCTSNARRAFIGDMMIVRASRDLQAGTEITFWYHSPMVNSAEEMRKKLGHWDFICDCAICRDARTTDDAVFQKRQRLLNNMKQLFDSVWTNKKMEKIESLLESLDRTYAQPTDEVPRISLWDPQLAVARAYAMKNDMTKSLKWIGRVLNSLGFTVTGADSTPTTFAVIKWGLTADYLVQTFLQAGTAFTALGFLEKSEQAEEYARIAYKIVIGEDSSFSATYG